LGAGKQWFSFILGKKSPLNQCLIAEGLKKLSKN